MKFQSDNSKISFTLYAYLEVCLYLSALPSAVNPSKLVNPLPELRYSGTVQCNNVYLSAIPDCWIRIRH
jgi:hypothetical protein